VIPAPGGPRSRAVDILIIEEHPDDLPWIIRALQAYPNTRTAALRTAPR
jgi:hypothetical protein